MKYWDGAKQEGKRIPVYPRCRAPQNGNPIGIPRVYSTDESIVNTSLDTPS